MFACLKCFFMLILMGVLVLLVWLRYWHTVLGIQSDYKALVTLRLSRRHAVQSSSSSIECDDVDVFEDEINEVKYLVGELANIIGGFPVS